MIDAELVTQESGPDRKQLLGMMADVRGSLGLSLANIRAFCLPAMKNSMTIIRHFGQKTKNGLLISQAICI